MNHAGLGYIGQNGVINLAPDLLEPLSITYDSLLFGLYYPRIPNKKGYEYAKVKHDFMLTPVPPKLWSRSARVLIRLRQRPESLKVVTAFFKRNHISVVFGECSRSAHRYATWSFHIAFENIPEITPYDSKLGISMEVFNAIEDLKRNLVVDCEEVLFTQEKDATLKDALIVWPNTALAFFDKRYRFNEHPKEFREEWIYKPFKLRSKGNGLILAGDSKLLDILKVASRNNGKPLVPAIVFAEVDTQFTNFRLAIIPQHDHKRFFEVGVTYTRTGEPETCTGIISSVLSCFPESYNLWRMANVTKSNTDSREEGTILFLVEDQRNPEYHNQELYEKQAEVHTASIKASDFPEGQELPESIELNDVSISCLSDEKILRRLQRKRLRRSKYVYDVFISYSSTDEAFAKQINERLQALGLKGFLSAMYVEPGQDFSEEIRLALLNSHEMCVLCSRDSIKSYWVHSEWGAAWALEKNIVPILLQVDAEELPNRLKAKQAIKFTHLDDYMDLVLRNKSRSRLSDFEELYD